MQGVVAGGQLHRADPRLLRGGVRDFAELTGRYYGLVTEYKTDDADTVFVSLGSAAENIEAAVDYLRERRGVTVGSIHINVFRPFPEAAVVKALAGKKNVIVLERTDEPMAGDNPMGRDIRTALNKALQGEAGLPTITADQMPRLFGGVYGLGSRDFRPEHTIGAHASSRPDARPQGRQARVGRRVVHGARRRSSVRGEVGRHAVAAARQGDRGPLPLRRRLGRHHDRQEPRRDHRRPQRSALRARQGRRRVRQPEGDHPRQRQPEIRIREEGRRPRTS